MKTLLTGWTNFWSFIAQFFQDATGKSSSTRLTGYAALATLIYTDLCSITLDSTAQFMLVGIVAAAFGFKLVGEKD